MKPGGGLSPWGPLEFSPNFMVQRLTLERLTSARRTQTRLYLRLGDPEVENLVTATTYKQQNARPECLQSA